MLENTLIKIHFVHCLLLDSWPELMPEKGASLI